MRLQDLFERDLNEIERLGPGGYRGGKSFLYAGRNAKKFKKLPGGSGLLYSIEDGRFAPSIKLWDPNTDVNDAKPRRHNTEFSWDYQQRVKDWEERQKSGLKLPQIIGKLELESPYDFPLRGALQVGTITVDEDYRGMGLAKALYGIVLTIMKRPLVAGSAQTPGGRRNWVSLSQIPGVEMKGYIAVEEFDLKSIAPYDLGNGRKGLDNYDQNKNKRVDSTIDDIMGKLGGEYIGKKNGTHYFAFDVQPSSTGAELQAVVKTKLASVYGGSYSTGLYAVWTGQ